MNTITIKKAFLALLLISSFYASAQGGVDEDEDPVTAPINSNISILLVSGILLGIVLISKNKKANSL